MLGRSILVAPVFSEDGTVEFYLPKGTWVSVDGTDTRTITTGQFFKEKRGYLDMPVFIRQETD